jgi:ABC-2 type transport system permease protein
VSQGLIAVVYAFGWSELAQRVRTGDIAIGLARPVDLPRPPAPLRLAPASFMIVKDASTRTRQVLHDHEMRGF